MADRPNILLVTTDQQRYDTVLPHRPDFLRTPHLDDLARKGFSFGQARTTVPICVPARCTIMSGRYEWNHGMLGNAASRDALDGVRTLPDRLRELGYDPMAIGKMHFGPHRRRHGFNDCLIADDYFRDLRRRGITEHEFMHGLGQNEWYPGRSSVGEPLTYTSWIAERCVEYLRERRDRDRPFFLWTSFGKPHPPYDPPAPYDRVYENAAIAEPAVGEWAKDPDRCPPLIRRAQLGCGADLYPPDLWRAIRQAYYGLVTQIDYNLGRVFAALQDRGELAETLVVFTSDHGDWLGDHRLAGKGCDLETCTRVPMIFRPPASWGWDRPGEVRNELVCLADLLPTLVGAAGGAADDVDGMDLLALARGSVEPRGYLEGMGCGDPAHSSRSITDGRWKYHWFVDGPAELLFDLASDPHETNDLAADPGHAEVKERLRAELDKRVRAHPQACDRDGLPANTDVEPIDEAACRAGHWVGYHTEHVEGDVFH